MTERLVKVLFAPITFAIGFLVPLVAQVLSRLGWFDATLTPWLVAAVLVLPMGLSAQLRGSWLWIR